LTPTPDLYTQKISTLLPSYTKIDRPQCCLHVPIELTPDLNQNGTQVQQKHTKCWEGSLTGCRPASITNCEGCDSSTKSGGTYPCMQNMTVMSLMSTTMIIFTHRDYKCICLLIGTWRMA
jgi:hypothetical protein